MVAKKDDKKQEGEGEIQWQDTVYIWDGIVTIFLNKEQVEDGKTKIPIQWEGTWIAKEAVADATLVEAPKRNAFAEYVDSDNKFIINGIADPINKEEKEEGNNAFIAKLTDGEGWDMDDGSGKKQKYQDTEHDILVKSLKWSGNMYDQTENLIVGKGKNEFGPFIGIGWMRPGNRWTVARRYLADEKDPRMKWSLEELQQAAINESVEHVEDTGQMKLLIPPWQCSVLHSKYQEPKNNKRKIDESNPNAEKDGPETKEVKQ